MSRRTNQSGTVLPTSKGEKNCYSINIDLYVRFSKLPGLKIETIIGGST
jgi:hypothetical protein